MKEFSKQLLLTIAAIILSNSVLSARTDEQKTARHELRTQLSQFAKNSVFPSLHQWKSQLDRAMQPEDLIALNTLRQRASDLRKQAKTAMKSMHESWKNEDYAMLKSSRESLKTIKQDRDNLFAELKPIAIKYKETLKTIGETAKPKVAEWKEKGREIVKSWAESHPEMAGKARGFKGGFLSHLGGGDKKVAVARFMLWNGDENIIDEMDQEQFKPTPPQNENEGSLEPTNYPNPFGTNTSINFSLPKNDKVSLKVYDLNGNIIETLADGSELSAGEHSYNFSPNTPSGTYFYRLETSEGSTQKTMEFVK
ncbi:MAG: T9SS type A sorting domain-containing protein [Ignavibacteria bacterium]|nr:T9SS type A sorting domain-containing protein [Ignavibacteria bacterium]